MQVPQTMNEAKPKDRRGFALPVVLFTMVIMSAIAVVALNSSVEEQKTSQAVRYSAEAFFAAQSGIGDVLSDWNDASNTLDSLTDELDSGESLTISSVTLASGAGYQGEIMLLTDTGDPMYLLTVTGWDKYGASERELSVFVSKSFGMLKLGGCCEAAAMVRGGVNVGSFTSIDGTDTDPPEWPAATCSAYEEAHKPGVIMDTADVDLFDISSSGYVESQDSITNNPNNWAPPAVVEQELVDSSFDIYGSTTLDAIKAAATTVLGDGSPSNIRYFWGGNPVSDGDYNDPDIFGPRVHTLGDPHGHLVGDPTLGTCDTGAALNFGAPSGPCADHFPIVWINGQVELVTQEFYDLDDDRDLENAYTNPRWYGQGLFVMDTLDNGFGSEFELESPGEFRAIVVGKGCFELQDGSQTHGAVYLDGAYFDQDLCDGALPFNMRRKGNNNWTQMHYSECVVQKVLEATGLGETVGTGSAGVMPLGSRSFTELQR